MKKDVYMEMCTVQGTVNIVLQRWKLFTECETGIEYIYILNWASLWRGWYARLIIIILFFRSHRY